MNIITIKNWTQKHKKRTAFVILIILMLIFSFIIVPNFFVIKFPSKEAYTSFAYTTDVAAMKSVNKMVIKTQNGSTTITDKVLIKDLVSQTIIGNSSGVGCFSWGGYIDEPNEISLYNDDKLVRKMEQSTATDGCWGDSIYAGFIAVKIFNSSLKHRILDSDEAWSYLSTELVENLETELNRHDNSYFKISDS